MSFCWDVYVWLREPAPGLPQAFVDHGAVVLGLSIDDPDNSPATRREARKLIGHLRQQFAASAGIAGVEMPPPGSRHQWHTDHAQIRVGTIPDDPA
ncbi:hypothetical protein ACWEOZ_01230 [Actinoplanes sp. NPDC004185]